MKYHIEIQEKLTSSKPLVSLQIRLKWLFNYLIKQKFVVQECFLYIFADKSLLENIKQR